MGGVIRVGGLGGRKNSRRRAGGAAPMSEINVTPFVDVMLVLLIVFMVSAPLLAVGVPVNLPSTNAQSLPTEPQEPVTLTLTPEGEVYLQNSVVDIETLPETLTAILQERENDKVYLRADTEISYGAVMNIMGTLNASGFTNIALVTGVSNSENTKL